MLRGSFLNTEKRFKSARAQRLPNLDHFVGDDRREGHSEPNTNCFDREAGPRPDVKPHEDTRPVFPPTVRQRERHLPKQTDQQKEEKRETDARQLMNGCAQ